MLAQGDKKRALLALRRKKYQESLLAKTDAQLEQLEKLTSNVEFALIQKDVVFGLQQGTKVLKEIHSEMGGIENVEKLMGETADAIAYQNVSGYGLNSNLLPCSLMAHSAYRKLARCWAARYQTRTRTKSKTSWRLSRSNCQDPSRSLYPMYPIPTCPSQRPNPRGSRQR